MKTKRANKFIFWTPRILSILFILFLALLSLDVFAPGESAKDVAIGLFMHNIPVIILILVLIVSWKYEIVGGIAFILAGLAYIAWLFTNPFELYMLFWSIQISGPAFLIGALFLIGWKQRKK